jgi:general secretion pathway protein J
MRIAECGLQNKRRKIRNPKSEIRNGKGFTLIEVLLAMAILAVVITVVYGSFSTASRNIEQAEESRNDTDVARALLSRLSDDLANAYVNTPLAKTTVFYGKMEETESGSEKFRHDSISLTTLTNWRRPDTKEMELWEVGYFFKEKPEGQGYALYRREKRVLDKDIPVLEGGDEYEMTDRVESLQLRYYNVMNKQWGDDWDTRKSPALPKAVEITLALDTGKVYVTQVDIVNVVQAGH